MYAYAKILDVAIGKNNKKYLIACLKEVKIIWR